jgi:hypothetical protein
MPSHNKERTQAMDRGVRRQIGSDANRRYLRELPIFRVEPHLPAKLRSLLEAIDRNERKGADRQG